MIRDYFPWWSKILIKIILSRIPVSYSIWQKFNLFRHGAMDDPSYAYKTFLRHYETANLARRGAGFVMLELGPGDSLASGIIAKYLGADKSILVDRSDDAVASTIDYRKIIGFLDNIYGEAAAKSHDTKDIEKIKQEWNIEYLTEGLASLKTIPDSSVDYIWSQSVIEHIKLEAFRDYIREFRRIIKNNGVSVHGIDLKDHLSYALNNLRFSEALWESEFMSKSGFYTNRLRYSELIDIFSGEGFGIEVLNIEKWNRLPTIPDKLDPKFRNISSEELEISAFDVILHPK